MPPIAPLHAGAGRASRALLLACAAAGLLRPAPAAPLSFTLRPDHPRIHLTSEAIDRLRALPRDRPLNGAGFPQEGTLVLELEPSRRWLDSLPADDGSDADAASHCSDTLFGAGDAPGILLRHLDPVAGTASAPSCNTGAASVPVGQCRFQLAVVKDSTSWPASAVFTIPCDQRTTVRISWRTSDRTVLYQLGAAPPVELSTGNVPAGWAPSGQSITLRGREDAIDDLRVYRVLDPSTAGSGDLLLDAPFDEGRGGAIHDRVSGAVGLHLRAARWLTRADGDPAVLLSQSSTAGRPSSSVVTETSELQDLWTGFLARAERWVDQLGEGTLDTDAMLGITGNSTPWDLSRRVKDLTLAYRVTGDARYKQAAYAFLSKVLEAVTLYPDTRSTGGIPDDSTQAGRAEALGIAYDALFDEAGVDRRPDGTTWRAALLAGIRAQLDSSTMARTIARPYASAGHTWENTHCLARAVLAVLDEAPDLAPAAEQLYQNMVGAFLPLRAWATPDGGHYFGWDYGAVYSNLDSVLLWETATTDVTLSGEWMSRMVDFWMYGQRADGGFPAMGDAMGLSLGSEAIGMLGLYSFTRGDNGAGRAWYQDQSLAHRASFTAVDSYFELAHARDSAVERVELEDLPLSRHFSRMGFVVARDSWDYPSATHLAFKSASFFTGNHQHLDQNSFTLYYRAPLLVDDGVYDSYGSTHWCNYYRRTVAHNSLLVFDPTESVASDDCRSAGTDGGQKGLTSYPTLAQMQPGGASSLDGIIAYQEGEDFTYAVGNASKAYSSSKLDQDQGFRRSILFLRSVPTWSKPVLLVFDRVQKTEARAARPARILFHTVNEPEPAGGTATAAGVHTMPGPSFTIRNGGALAYATTLLPEGAVLTKVGGTAGGDHRFMVPTSDTAYSASYTPGSLQGTGRFAPEAGAWRVEVTSPAPAQEELFLHAIAVADDVPGAAPLAVTRLDATGAASALLGGALVVAFATGQDAADLATTVPAAATRLVAAGLRPSARFDLELSSSPEGLRQARLTATSGGRYQASDAGVLSISLAAPGGEQGGSAAGGCGCGAQPGGGATALALLLAALLLLRSRSAAPTTTRRGAGAGWSLPRRTCPSADRSAPARSARPWRGRPR